jgi:maltooligosyltrehalose trehalohydrolase
MSRGDFGARLLAPGEVRFRLWAPDCAAVNVVTEQQKFAMSKDEHGVFEAVVPGHAGMRYKYEIAENVTVPDPASRAQHGGVHGDSVVVDHARRWDHAGWRGRPWHESVIYELHPGAFGGFAGIAAQLPRLAALGVTVVELMPIAAFPGTRNWGYDGVLPYAPAAAYGTPEELQAMIDTAHGLGLQVFLDVVYNHFGPDGNYLHLYAREFFREDVRTPWGAAIDFRRPQVRRFFIENALHWLQDYRFDGLRFDAVHAIGDDLFLAEMAAEIRQTLAGRHVHLVLENEMNEAALLRAAPDEAKYDAQWTDDWHHCLHVLLACESEGYYRDFQDPAAQLARCLAEGFAYQGEASAHAGGAPRGTPSAHLPPTAFVICLQNHDQIGNRAMGERLTALARPDALRAATVLLLLTPQIPMLFMGEEFAATEPFLFFTDHHDELADAVRRGRRAEFAHFAAFADPGRREQIPDPNAPETFAASVPQWPGQPGEASAFCRQLLALRRQWVTPHLPGARSLEARPIGPKAIRAAWRLANGGTLTIAANFGAAAVPCPPGAGARIISTAEPGPWDDTLAPFCAAAWVAA